MVAAAVVTLDPDPPRDLVDSVIAHCRAEVGGQLAPRRVFVTDSLPRTEAGKLYRHRLVERFSGVTPR